ncbi:MAG: type IIL restriction-modification enzyme MmeI, partial [Chitinophagaceae bacterium]
NGKDLTSRTRGAFVIDLFGHTHATVRSKFPDIFQHVLNFVKPERDQNRDKPIRENWWLFGRTRGEIREALKGLKRYIATVETAKYRFFTFLNNLVLPDNMLVAIALDDAYDLGVLSSRHHIIWALATGSDLGGNTPRYNKSRCFETFPFPDANNKQKEQIRTIAEQLDAHRKQRQALYSTLTITDMYNVMEKMRKRESLNAKEQRIHEQGLVSILLQLHNELDNAVSDAYIWPANISEEEILEKLVALNKERAAEEARGLIRWIRPEYQNPGGVHQTGLDIGITEEYSVNASTELPEWPKNLAEQAQAIQRIIQQYQHPISATYINNQFKKATKASLALRGQQIGNILETISMLGLLRKTDEGLFVR